MFFVVVLNLFYKQATSVSLKVVRYFFYMLKKKKNCLSTHLFSVHGHVFPST